MCSRAPAVCIFDVSNCVSHSMRIFEMFDMFVICDDFHSVLKTLSVFDFRLVMETENKRIEKRRQCEDLTFCVRCHSVL